MAFDFYFAGTQCKEANDIIVRLNANVLKSYINDRKEISKWFEHKRNGWKGKLLIDNGAFTIHRRGGVLDIDAYIKWLNDNIDYIDYAIALDDIPGKWGEVKTKEQVANSPINTWNNYLYMIERLSHPEKLLPVFHMGENLNHLKAMLDSDELCSDYICISGNKELTNSQREDWYAECFQVIKQSKRPDIKVHCLGSATIQNAEKFPFTSMDATSWIMAGANGNILTDFGPVYVGDNCKTLRRTIPAEYLTTLEEDCKALDTTLEEAGQDYKIRMCLNVSYLYRKSTQAEFKGMQLNKRRLF